MHLQPERGRKGRMTEAAPGRGISNSWQRHLVWKLRRAIFPFHFHVQYPVPGKAPMLSVANMFDSETCFGHMYSNVLFAGQCIAPYGCCQLYCKV